MCRKKAFMRMILASVTGPGLFQGHESRQVDENALEIFPPTVWKEALLQSQHCAPASNVSLWWARGAD